jgi:signal transduction histidine kinase
MRPVAVAATATIWLGGLVAVVLVDHRLSQLGRPDLHQFSGPGAVFAFAHTSACAVGVLLLLRRPEHPVGWCLVALGTAVAATGGLQAYGLLGLDADPSGSHPGAAVAALLASSLFVSYLVAIALICYLTPTGRYLSARWARCAQVMAFAGGVWFVVLLVDPGKLQAPFRDVENPWGLTALAPVLHPLRQVSGALNNVLVLVSFASLLVRFRRSRGEERRQLLWLGLALVPVPLLVAAAFVASRTRNDDVLNLAAGGFVAVLPVAVGLAVAKTRLCDVDLILSRAAAYLLLSALLAGTYATTVLLITEGVWGIAGDSSVAIVLATLAVAALARPAHRTIQDALDRRFNRRRYDALRRVRAHVDMPAPGVDIEQVLREALRAPELVINYWVPDRETWVRGDGSAAHPGEPFTVVTRTGRTVAQVFGSVEDPVLVEAALREAAPELDNTALRAAVSLQLVEVRASRTRLANAQLEERSRIERDLHDGAQQRLLALAAQLQAALLNGDPGRMRDALTQGVSESRAAVIELRDLANGLHPQVLTDGGLSATLDQLSARHPIEVRVVDATRRYPARVEATAWFIVCEGVSNALKHAEAATIGVHVEVFGQDLRILVSDDGLGGADARGSGLRGLSDRAEAVGGRLSVSSAQPGGTVLEAVLPCGS